MRIVFAVLTITLAAFTARAEDKTNAPAAPAAPGQPGPDEVVARVNGKEIKRKELQATEQAFMARLAARGQTVSQAQIGEFEHEVLQEMVGRELVLQEGSKRTIPDLDAKVQKELADVKKQRGGDEAFAAALKDAGMTETELIGHIRDGIVLREATEAVLKGKNGVSADEIKSFYDSQKQRFRQPEQVRASHILIRCAADAPQKEKDEKRAHMDVVRTRLKQGEKFADVAKKSSEDPGSASVGGDLGFFGRGSMVPEFETAAFTLPTNQVSDVITTQFGYHILMVTDHKAARDIPLDEVKADIERYLKNRKSTEVAQKHVKELRDAAKIEILLKDAPPAAAPAGIGIVDQHSVTPPVAAPAK